MWQYEKKAMLSVYDDFSLIMYEARSLKTMFSDTLERYFLQDL